jgi:hypothetical protein
MLISEAIEPAEGAHDQFREWYRDTYVRHLARMPGWRRTSQFQLVFKKENKDESGTVKAVTPRWLSLHEFEGNEQLLDSPGDILDGVQGAHDIIEGAKKVDVAAFKALRGFGDVDACWVDSQEAII